MAKDKGSVRGLRMRRNGVNRRDVLLGTLYAATLLPSKASAFMDEVGKATDYGIYNVKIYGATGNGISLTGGSMSVGSTTLIVSGAHFSSADAGKPICVAGAGANGAPLVTTIASGSGDTAQLAANAVTAVTDAIVTYGTDDSSAIQAAINACFTAGGGIVWFPRGLYMISGPFQKTSTHNSLLYIPYVSPASSPISITFAGETQPTNNVNCCGTAAYHDPPIARGSILFTPVNGSGTNPALICPYAAGTFTDFTNVNFSIYNLVLRSSYKNPIPLLMVHAQWTAYAEFHGVTIDVAATSSDQWNSPPTPGGFGITMPQVQNGSTISLVYSIITGYDTGIVVGEHAHIRNLTVLLARYAIYLVPSYHDIHMGGILVQWSNYILFCPGGTVNYANKVPLEIDMLDIEHCRTGWCRTFNDVLDSSNEIYGKLTYNVVTADVGYDNSSFTKSGGTNLVCTPLF